MPVTPENPDSDGIPDSVIQSRPALASLAWFLRVDIEGPKPKDWERNQRVAWAAPVVAKDLAGARQVQAELRKDLAVLTNPKQRPSTAEADRVIARLIRAANETSVSPRWSVQRYEYNPGLGEAVRMERDPETGHSVIYLRSKEAELPRSLVTIPVVTPTGETVPVHWRIGPYYPRTAQARPFLYRLVAQVLEQGGLQDLRSCPQCHTFFVVEDPRKEFCSAQCRDTFNNKQRLESGYFFDLRHKKRERELRMARKLLDAGKSAEEVVAETSLPVRVLQREIRKRAKRSVQPRKKEE